MPHTLDFDIYEDYNPKMLTFLDKSDYDGNPVSPRLEIKLPGYKSSYIMNIIPSQPNFFGSKLLSSLCAAECTYLPDGVYTLTYSVVPRDENNITKRWLRTTLIEYKKFNALLRRDLTDRDKDALEQFDFLLQTAKAYAYNDNTQFATEYYHRAEDIINQLNTCC